MGSVGQYRVIALLLGCSVMMIVHLQVICVIRVIHHVIKLING